MNKPKAAHFLKNSTDFWIDTRLGCMRAQLRSEADRQFVLGERMVLRDWDGTNYTGKYAIGKITHVLRDYPGIEPGYALISFQLEGWDLFFEVSEEFEEILPQTKG